jgi:hexosaminidase
MAVLHGRAAEQPLPVMPAPAEVRLAGGRVPAGTALVVTTTEPANERLSLAISKAKARWQQRMAGAAAQPTTVTIKWRADAPLIPRENEDESYILEVEKRGVTLSAATDIGALRGLETLLQMPERAGNSWSMAAATIADAPRFPWRGLMIDVARHWQPTGVIERNIDAMAAVKLNVLHLHLTDDQGFRIESRTHPELQAKGSDGKYFTQEQMAGIIRYAALRGIRVVPEFDVPGHATSWVVSHPELASLPGPYGIERHWGVFNPVLDPTKEATYALLGDFLREMAALFPDPFIHIGGDENNGVQWNANRDIQAFIASHGLKDNAGLHAYFNQRVAAILAAAGKRVVGWDEILNPALPRSCVIDSWRGDDGIAAAAKLGFDCILSHGFYIDLMYPASDHYLPDPLPPGNTLTPAERAHVLGGEATMWAEWVTPETIDSRIWPRTAAVAERLWSPADIRDVPDMYRRLDAVSPQLAAAGSLHLSNRDVMLKYLVGENLSAPGVGSLRTLISLLEPVKWYRRGGLQPWSNQLIPLIGLADAAVPDSGPSRDFSRRTDEVLFGGKAIDAAGAQALIPEVESWAAASKEVVSVAETLPGVWQAVPSAKDLADASSAALEALRSLAAGRALPPDARARALASLARASLPNPSATELPVIDPVRLLVAAAAEQGRRAALGEAEWRKLVEDAAYPQGRPAREK